MSKRRTLDLPDSPGVWIYRMRNGSAVRCVQVYPGPNDTLFVDDLDGCARNLDYLYELFSVEGQWQGPIEWEDSNG